MSKKITKKASVGDVFYKAVVKKLQEQQKKYDSKDGNLIQSKANNARVAIAVNAGFGAIEDVVGMMLIVSLCDFSETKEEND